MLDPATLTSFENPGGLTPLEIAQAINHVRGTSIIDFSFRLLDRRLEPITLPGGGNNGDPAELPPPYLMASSLEMNSQRDVHRQMKLALAELPGLQYNPVYHRIQPHVDYWTYANGSYTRQLHIPQGVFTGILPNRTLADRVPVWDLTLYDETWGLARKKCWNPYVVKAGTNKIAAAMRILTLPLRPPSLGGTATTPDGCGMIGPAIDISRIDIPYSDTVIDIDILFTSDDSLIKMVNTLLGYGTDPYWPLFEDARGIYRSYPMPFFSATAPQTGWTYDSARTYDASTGQGNIIKPPVKQSFDMSAIRNAVQVKGENPAADAVYAEAFNNDVRSMIAIDNLDDIITGDPVSDDTITTVTQAQTRANMELQIGASVTDTIDFDAMPNPLHDVHDGLPITIRGQGPVRYTGVGTPEIDVTFGDGPVLVSSDAAPYVEVSWSIDYQQKVMHHTAGIAAAI